MNNKLKLSLIDDYIKLVLTKKVFKNNNIYIPFYRQVNNLCEVYEDLFFKIGLMNFSFLKLKQELNDTPVDYLNYNYTKHKTEFDDIANGLILKLKKLKFNEAEIFYINQHLLLQNF